MEEEAAAAAPLEDGADDDFVTGAFAARERVKGGFDFLEHPLERRANEAKNNDCKVCCVLLVFCIGLSLWLHEPKKCCSRSYSCACVCHEHM